MPLTSTLKAYIFSLVYQASSKKQIDEWQTERQGQMTMWLSNCFHLPPKTLSSLCHSVSVFFVLCLQLHLHCWIDCISVLVHIVTHGHFTVLHLMLAYSFFFSFLSDAMIENYFRKKQKTEDNTMQRWMSSEHTQKNMVESFDFNPFVHILH